MVDTGADPGNTGAQAQGTDSPGVLPRRLLPGYLRSSGIDSRGYPDHRRPRQTTPPRQEDCPLISLLRSSFGYPRQEEDAEDHNERLNRRAVRVLRRQVSVGDALGGDSPQYGMDRIPFWRSPGAAMAPDDWNQFC